MSRDDLSRRQGALVAALVAGGPTPAGFDPDRIEAAAQALLRKRAGEAGAFWPGLRAGIGPQWNVRFAEWARGRPPVGALRDGWDLARRLVDQVSGPAGARIEEELARREAQLVYDGLNPPRPRRLPAIRRVGGTRVLQVAGRIQVLTRTP